MISQARFALFSVLMTSSRPHTGSSRTPPATAIHPPSLANARRRMFAQQELDSCWVQLFVDRRAHTRRSVSPSARLFNQTCRFRLFILLPHLQVRAGGFSPHARSLTPAWCLFRRREEPNVLLLRYVRPLGCLFNQIFVPVPPPSCAKAKRMFFAHAEGQISACSFFVSVRGRMSRVSGLYTVHLLPSLACKGELEVFSHNAKSLTPAECFLLGDRRVCSTRSAVLSPCRVSKIS
jgi:hypothetical protein